MACRRSRVRVPAAPFEAAFASNGDAAFFVSKRKTGVARKLSDHAAPQRPLLQMIRRAGVRCGRLCGAWTERIAESDESFPC